MERDTAKGLVKQIFNKFQDGEVENVEREMLRLIDDVYDDEFRNDLGEKIEREARQ